MKRRSFFKSIAAVVAAVALAPEIAFNVRIKEKFDNWKQIPGFWTQSSRAYYCYSDTYKKFIALALQDQNVVFEKFRDVE